MTQQRHSTEIVVSASTSAAEAAVDRLLAKFKQLNALGDALRIGPSGGAPGGGGGGGGAPAIPNPGGAAPAPPPPAPSAGSGAPPLPPPAPSADGGGRPAPGGGGMPAPGGGWRGGYGGGWRGGPQPTANPWQQGGVLQWGGNGIANAAGAVGGAYASGLYGVSPLLQRGFAQGLPALSSAAGSVLKGASTLARKTIGRGVVSGSLGILGGVARSMGVLGAPLAALAGIGGASFAQRMALNSQYQGIEKSNFALNAMGLPVGQSGGLMGLGAQYGLGPQQSTDLLKGVFSQFGGRSGLNGAALARETFGAEVSGLGSSALGSWMRLAGPGGGGRWGGDGAITGFQRARGAALRLGMSGAREGEYISGLTQIGAGRAEQGMMTDVDRLNRFAFNVGKQGGGARGLGGMRAARGMTGLGQRAYGQFTSAFSGLGEAAVMAQALEGGGSPMEIASRLAKTSGDPYAMRRAITDAFGGDAGTALLGAGLSPDLAKGVLRAGGGGAPRVQLSQANLAAGLPVSRAQAQVDAAKLAEVMKEPEWAAKLIRVNGIIAKSLLELTGPKGYAKQILILSMKSVAMFENIVAGLDAVFAKIKKYWP